MYEINSKMEKRNTIKLPFASISSKAGNDINRLQTVSDRKISALSNHARYPDTTNNNTTDNNKRS